MQAADAVEAINVYKLVTEIKIKSIGIRENHFQSINNNIATVANNWTDNIGTIYDSR